MGSFASLSMQLRGCSPCSGGSEYLLSCLFCPHWDLLWKYPSFPHPQPDIAGYLQQSRHPVGSTSNWQWGTSEFSRSICSISSSPSTLAFKFPLHVFCSHQFLPLQNQSKSHAVFFGRADSCPEGKHSASPNHICGSEGARLWFPVMLSRLA